MERLKMRTTVYVIWVAVFAGSLQVLVSGEAGSGAGDHHVIPKELAHLLTDVEKSAIASVDGDPDFIVGVRGLAQPLCFRLEGQPGHVVRLLQDPESGVVVNARISRPVPDAPRTYLSAVLIARRNFRVVAKVGRVLVNRYRFAWGPVSVRRVHGHRVLIAPTLLALTLRNMNVTLVVKRHLPEGRRPTANDTNPAPAPNTASLLPDASPSHHNRTNVVIASRSARRRGGRRHRPDDIDHGPRQRNRRHRRPPTDHRRKKQKKERSRSSAAKPRSRREAWSRGRKKESLFPRKPRRPEPTPDREEQERYGNVVEADSSSKRPGSDDADLSPADVRSWLDGSGSSDDGARRGRASDGRVSDGGSRPLPARRSRRSAPCNPCSRGLGPARGNPRRTTSRRARKRPRDGARGSPSRRSSRVDSRRSSRTDSGRSSRTDSGRSSRTDSGRSSRTDSGRSSRTNSRRSSRTNSRRPSRADSGSSDNTVALSSRDGAPTRGGDLTQEADDDVANVSVSRDDVSPGGGLIRDMAAYVGFYVADARDLSSQTHGLLGQFLHKAVTLQRVRQKTNGIMKARLLVERPRPHHVKATLRTRTNMALNSSSTCWWLREGGLGVVDGVYADYLVSRFRATDFLPLPPGLIGQ